MEYDVDETLEIKEEIIQDQEAITIQKRDKTNESKFCTVYVREDDILEIKPKPQTLKKQKMQESEQKHTCEKCGRTYKNKCHMNYHQKYLCGVMPQFSCKFCNKQFKRKSVMNAHVNRVHRSTNSKTVVFKHKCDKCSRSYNWLGDLVRHKRLVHALEKPQFICDFCGHRFNAKYHLVGHIVSLHSQTSKSRHECDKCARSYKWPKDLNRHKRLIHAAVKSQFICDFCGHKFDTKDHLVVHMTLHYTSQIDDSPKSTYKCDQCSRSYSYRRGLTEHKRLVHGEVKLQFTCDICGFKTKRKQYLSRHITSKHLNE
ncbi:zinc finger protein 718-like [Belonocnema kinseyi]|uniref:zinc finger protein 718-like n=1 Tax=Belonocnema kinseyi TaxID=2817044 RepID=UPI00143CFE59|nr:zinc finger protein 718-like [Belonocnema kinseyi]